MTRPIQDFLSRARARFDVDQAASYGDWITQNTLLRGRPFSMAKYPFQQAIADDMHENLSVIKCSQVGLTEVQVRKILAFVKRNKGVNAIYTLPDEAMFKKVSQMRVKPCIEENAVFQPESGEKMVRSMSTMQFGTSFLLMTNATEGAATSTPADYLVHDEVDLTDQGMLSLFQSRLQNSEWRIKHRFSTPTFFGFGIDGDYEVTDQREWVIRCPYCRHVQIPDFTRDFVVIPGLPDDIEDLGHITESLMPKLDLLGAYVMCERCHQGPLDLDDEGRRWVAQRPDIQHARGYRVRPLSTGRIGIPYIIGQLLEYKRRDYLRGWSNTVLGKPYIDGNIRLERADIEACIAPVPTRPDEVDPTRPHFLGIDMGAVCHLILGVGTPEDCDALLFETIPANDIVDRVKGLCGQVNIVAGAVDRHPYTPTAHDIFEVSGRKVFPVEYRGSAEINIVFDEFKNPAYAQADRTSLLDVAAKSVRSKRITLCGYGHQKETIITHFRDNVRDEKPESPARWVKLKGDDHYFHALGFMLFSLRLWQALQPLRKAETRTLYETIGADWVPDDVGLLVPSSHSQGLLSW
ncbi:hypothetical protein D3877_23455 [Azospirillum cavernae]|uniref:Phage terminase large subunit GpA ATPase domain-containing protein n=1 Tax=Azospirillum cavernae TaxID=2320860 RepID=A0A418VP83_9PROT|nr:phage terminase large subunit family protein [Azospirillum cavernae]RJF78090.1 hypothetical protein D3877_23455 [Azospirillum cavernae]